MKKRWINVALCCLLAIAGRAQNGSSYKYYAPLDTVRTPGFYNIALSPEITAHLKTDYSDVRIVHNSQWVPHILNVESDMMREPYLRELKFTIPENNRQRTVVTATANTFEKTTLNIVLTLRNTSAERSCSLSGSDDGSNWFVLNDSILLSPFPGLQQAVSEVRIPVPSSSYRYFRVTINNNNKDPFDITKVATAIPEDGDGTDKFPATRVIQNPSVRISQKDSGNITYIKVWQKENYHFDRISYELSGVKYFNRKAALYIPAETGQSMAHPGKLLASFSIADNIAYNTRVPVSNAKEFLILIYNEDNPPLNVSQVATSLNQRFITAYLDSGKEYQLLFDKESATAPVYDLKISDSIVVPLLPFLKTNGIVAMKHPEAIAAAAADYKWVLWVVLGAVLIALGFFSFKMFKEIDKKKAV